MQISVAIIGGGLAGLHAARLLHAANIDFLLFEARNRLGGRILSLDAAGDVSADGFDLGPSWFWPQMQPAIGSLVAELNLPSFPQASDGDVVFERMSGEKPQRFRGYAQEPQSMRLAGGTNALVRALAVALPPERLLLARRVTGAQLDGNGVVLTIADADGGKQVVYAEHVVFALPPRLLEASIAFSPAIDAGMARRWRATATWMAPHAKFLALYDRPFWRDAGLSGTAQSIVGPLVEIHDATTASGAAALFAFVGATAEQRQTLGEGPLTDTCVRQLGRLFGEEALRPRGTLFKDWSADSLTATVDDQIAGGHPAADRRAWVSGVWLQRISLAGSETSQTDPGYLAGAVEAAERTVSTIIHARRSAADRR
jgi:monoamine oxidase